MTLTSFSNAYANHLSCGNTVSGSIIFDADLDCTTLTTSGLIIGANSITIDLNSFTLSGDACGGCHGIRNENFNDVTITNGVIDGFEQGVRGVGVSNYVLDSLTFTGQTSSHAIDILDSASVTIKDSSITIPTTAFVGPEAIRLESVASVTVTNVNVVGGFIGVNFACGACDGSELPTKGTITGSTFDGAFIGVLIANSDDATITNNEIKNGVTLVCSAPFCVPDAVSDSKGISIGFNSAVQITGTTITNNQIFNNNGFGVRVSSTNTAGVDASSNYWGHPKGPTHSSNPDGQGDTVSDNIDFDPFYLNSARTNLSSDQTGSKLTPQGNTVKFDSDDANSSIAGQASLPPGIEKIELGNDAVLDVVTNLDTAVGNDINVGGQPKFLNDFSSGTLANVDLTVSKTVGDKQVIVKKAVKMKSGTINQPIIITNTALPSVEVSIPDATIILAPDGWDGTIQPPKTGSSSGTPPSGFSIGGTVIEVGSPGVVLLFDTPVDVLLSGVTGNVGYKPAASSTWVQITNTCGNTFDIPDPPTFPGECFISDGTDTKIVTFHFTTFGGLDAIVPKKSGSGAGGDKTKPVLQSNTLSSPGSVIFGGSLSLDPNQPPETSLFEINDEVNLELSFFENQGPKTIQHVALYMNIRDFDTRNDSDLWIEWNKGQPITVYDPNGFLKDNADVTTAINDANLDMTFHVTFVKPMETSNIVLYFWDFSRNGGLVTFEDAWKIVQPVSDLIDVAESGGLDQTMEEGFAETEESSSLDKIRQELNGAKPIPAWIKTSAGWWSEKKINDADFVSGIEFLIQNNIIEVPETEPLSKPSRHVPDWLGNTAGWWSEGLISDEEFIQSIQWLIANGVIVI